MKSETRTRGARRASENAAVAARISDDTAPASTLQVARLMHCFGLTPAVAQIVAELAYQHGRRA